MLDRVNVENTIFTKIGYPLRQAGQVTGQVMRLLSSMDGEMSRAALQQTPGLRHRDSFVVNYLQPALESELIEMTIPDKPNSRMQKYRLTDKGRALLVAG